MNKKTALAISVLLIIIGFCSCEVDFDPNSDWKETTIAYCLLDQDDDTTFVRVQKAFLGEGNYLEFSQIKDSIYYKQDDIDVKIYAYSTWDNDKPIDSLQFIYTTDYSKPEGDFYNGEAPIYYCLTQNRIRKDRNYKLVIRNLKTGNVTSSTIQPLADYNIEKPTDDFAFRADGNDLKMEVQWYNKNSSSAGVTPKLFQLMIRFYYKENGAETFVDVPLGKTINDNNRPHLLTSSISMNGLLSAIKAKLNNNQPKQWSDRTNYLELFVNACDVNMYDYININKPNENMLTDKPLFTNIDNGVGLFAARRLGVNIVFTKYRSSGDFAAGLKQLNIGFN
ncbi:MAG: hypothetical protein LBO06_02135 [Bacteroidales bacterium]|jgi:hypothetical protein|nr:hypothetical protein [Bacteroidales bacterium]